MPFAYSPLPEGGSEDQAARMPVTSTTTSSPPVTTRASAPATAGMAATRLTSIDVVRGALMVLMAIDHVRVYSGVPAGGPSAGIFFTRWVTHFCAPAFVFLAGTSAFLHGRKLDDAGRLARYLVTRGAVVLLLELTVIRVAWTFNIDFAHYILAGVIWMLGWCMILLAGLAWLPATTVGIVGLIVIGAHNLADLVPQAALQSLRPSWFWQLLYFGGLFGLGGGEGGPTVAVLYSIVPWIGVMAAGYGFGALMLAKPARRHRLCVVIGLSAIALFLVLRGLDLYGDPRHWSGAPPNAPPALFRFLNTTKYPASLLFLLMTLGPTIAVLPAAERARGAVGRFLETFGRVPMFYYLLHIPVIHGAALLVSLLREGRVNPWLFANHPMMNPPAPPGYTWSLPLLYLVFACVIAALYVPCHWFAGVKARQRGSLLSYI
jgi:uncharacterized membrane protein